MLSWQVKESEAGSRVDNFVTAKETKLSRKLVQTLCDTGKIRVNDKVTKPGHKLKNTDTVTVDFDLGSIGKVEKIELPVLYEDDDCIVIDKPAGVLSHSKGAFNPEGTVASFIVPKLKDMDGERAGIVHRLDRGTSGVMICAKNQRSLVWLQKQFSSRKVKKTYIAIISGTLEPTEAIIDMPIERNPNRPQTFRVGLNGRPAKTAYKIVQTSEKYSKIELTPQTGRTHQLRVHLKQVGHAIVGDELYGGENADRLYLHAYSIELTLPSRTRKKFIAKLPQVFNKIVASHE